MINLIPLIFKYRKYIAVIGLILALLGALFLYGRGEYRKGYDKAERVCMAEKQAALERANDIRREQNKVVMPSTADTLNRLRGGTF